MVSRRRYTGYSIHVTPTDQEGQIFRFLPQGLEECRGFCAGESVQVINLCAWEILPRVSQPTANTLDPSLGLLAAHGMPLDPMELQGP